MGTKGANKKSFAFYEELPFRATPNSNNVAIYKRHHLQKKLPLEQRNYFVHIPVENTNGGIRKSLRTINREDAIKKAEDLHELFFILLKYSNLLTASNSVSSTFWLLV